MTTELSEIENLVIAEKNAEIERLTAALKRANDNHEHYERQWYLVCDERDALIERRDVLLQMVANISQSTPLESEVAEALAQRGALIAEIGTLRSMVAGLEGEVAGLKVTAGFFQTRSEDMEKAIKGTLGEAEKRRNQGHCVLCNLTASEVLDDLDRRYRQMYERTLTILRERLAEALDWATRYDARHFKAPGGWKSELLPMYTRIGNRHRDVELVTLASYVHDICERCKHPESEHGNKKVLPTGERVCSDEAMCDERKTRTESAS